jgi:hypothetical protein
VPRTAIEGTAELIRDSSCFKVDPGRFRTHGISLPRRRSQSLLHSPRQ